MLVNVISRRLTPIIFLGHSKASAVECYVSGGQRAATLDLIDRLLSLPEHFAPPIVVTADSTLARAIDGRDLLVEIDDDAFHFGLSLAHVIARHEIERPFYIGGGSAPLLNQEELVSIAVSLRQAERLQAENGESQGVVIANNFFSSDFVAFSPGRAVEAISPPAIDNDLAFLLQRQVGLQNVPLTRTLGTQMDIDTPVDLQVLALHPDTGPSLRHYLRQTSVLSAIDTSRLDERLRAIMPLFVDTKAEITIAGRIGSHVLARLETDLACRKRVFSEERGMRASGREARGEARSLVAYHLEAVGPRRFFEEMASLGQALLLDTRVLFAHFGLNPTASDRFLSDLLLWERIEDPFVRDLTREAESAGIPVLLGGHSLVSGGLWALVDVAWRENDRLVGKT